MRYREIFGDYEQVGIVAEVDERDDHVKDFPRDSFKTTLSHTCKKSEQQERREIVLYGP